MKYLAHIQDKIKSALIEKIYYQQGSASVAVYTMVGTAKKKTMQFGIFVFVAVQETN